MEFFFPFSLLYEVFQTLFFFFCFSISQLTDLLQKALVSYLKQQFADRLVIVRSETSITSLTHKKGVFICWQQVVAAFIYLSGMQLQQNALNKV